MASKQAMGAKHYTRPRCQRTIYPPWPAHDRQCANMVMDGDTLCRLHRTLAAKLSAAIARARGEV